MFLRKGIESFIKSLKNEYISGSVVGGLPSPKDGQMKILLPMIDCYNKYLDLKKNIEAISLLKGEEGLEDLVEEEKTLLEDKLASSINELEVSTIKYLRPFSASISVGILEVRAGTGGDEASMFASSLLSSYWKYCIKKGINFSIQSLNGSTSPSSLSSSSSPDLIPSFEMVKHAKCRLSLPHHQNDESDSISIDDLLMETGVHRVQRVPKTDSLGRIHTSTAIVALMPELEEEKIVIKHKDLKIDLFRSSGPGGQNVNKVNSAVRITHIPSQISISCQEERTAVMNKAIAMDLLLKRLEQLEKNDINQQRKDGRERQMGTGDRSEKVRTYNYPQNRITDHRLNINKYGIDSFMAGEFFDEFHNLLKKKKIEELLEELEENIK